MLNMAAYFDALRASIFRGKMTPGQVAGTEHLLKFIGERYPSMHGRQACYVMATAFHETGAAMQPVREAGGPAYFHRMYDPESPDPKRAAIARRMGAKPGDGVLYYGRGQSQLTWASNYLKFERMLGVPLLADPDLALDPDVSARILVEGSLRGSFTGAKLGSYVGPDKEDYVGARRVINGTDRAELIAGYAKSFADAMKRAQGV